MPYKTYICLSDFLYNYIVIQLYVKEIRIHSSEKQYI